MIRIVPFIPGRRPTDEDVRPGLGSSDSAAMVTNRGRANRAVVLFELGDIPKTATVEATVTVDGTPLPGWVGRPVERTSDSRQRLVLYPDDDLASVDLSLRSGVLRRAEVAIRVSAAGEELASDSCSLDVCALSQLGSLYERIIREIVVPDATRQAAAAGIPDPGPEFHPWYPVLRIGGEKAALYTAALVADIVGKEDHLTDPAWLLRVGVYLELLTCFGIFAAVREDIGDVLTTEEREAFERSPTFAEIRRRIDPAAWRRVWDMRRITFAGFGTPRLGPVSALNLLRKRDTTMRFLHTHHDDLKHAIELAGPNRFNAQETWQRVFRDAERAVMRKAAEAFPELAFLPAAAREVVLWQRIGIAGQQGLYPTAVNQYRASMNSVADWGRRRVLMDYAGTECIPLSASVLEAHMRDRPRVEVLQRQDGLGPDLAVTEPAVTEQPTSQEIEDLLSEVPIFAMMSPENLHALALGARPLLLGPTQRFVVEGNEGTSLFLVGEGHVEVRLRNPNGTDWLVETMGKGEVVGEMALLTGEPRAATVRSVEETVVYEISKQQYQPLLLAHPEWLEELARVMEERLARRQARIKERGDRAESLVDRIRRNFFG